MKLALGADHAGFLLKQQLVDHLRSQGHEVLDLGTSSYEAVDYPLFAQKVARAVAEGGSERGIVVDGAGIGSAMAANKVPGIRAALAYDLSTARNSREHNDANVLTLGAGLIGAALARQIVDLWLASDCVEERHRRRVGMIEAMETGRLRAAVPGGSAGQANGPAGLPVPLGAEDLERILRELEIQLAGQEGARTPPVTGEATSPTTVPPTLALAGAELASSIDHTILKPEATAEQIRQLCAEARAYSFAAVCVNPVWVRLAARELAGSGVAVCTVVGFPLGASTPETKALEARRAIREGAREIDMVINVGALKSGDDDLVLRDIRAVVEAARDGSALCKVILENALLTDEEKRRACRLAVQARAHFVKTSTGFSSGGATAADVALMAAEVREAGLGVKAAGGIRSTQDALQMLAAGATRIGASASVAIVAGAATCEDSSSAERAPVDSARSA